MGVDSKPFDPKTYVEEDILVTDESGSQKRIRLDNNIVRWRPVRNSDGTNSVSECMGVLFTYLKHMNFCKSHACCTSLATYVFLTMIFDTIMRDAVAIK